MDKTEVMECYSHAKAEELKNRAEAVWVGKAPSHALEDVVKELGLDT